VNGVAAVAHEIAPMLVCALIPFCGVFLRWPTRAVRA
jgi:hypothetical protein